MNHITAISLEQNSSESLIVFEINNLSDMLRKTCVGQFVKSCIFELNFPASIGKSEWTVIVFPNGQYNCKGNPDKRISVYLKMINCEQESTAIIFDAKFQLGCGHELKQNQMLCFNYVTKRCIGTQLSTIKEIFRNDCPNTLILSVHLLERSSNNSSPRFHAGIDFCHGNATENKEFYFEMTENQDKTNGSKRNSVPTASSTSGSEKVICLDSDESEEDSVNSKSKMRTLLESWKLDVLYAKFDEYGFDYYSLQVVAEQDLTTIFQEPKFMGPLRKFRALHEHWIHSLKSASKNMVSSAADITVSSELTEPVGTSVSSQLSEPAQSSSDLNLNEILSKSKDSVELTNYYNERKKLLPVHRKLLVKIIVDHLISLNKHASDTKIGEMSRQISIVFPTEDKDDYQKKVGKRKTGLLQTTYNNRVAAITAKKLKMKALLGNTNNAELLSEDDVDSLSDEVKASIEWMKNFDLSSNDENLYESLIGHWDECFQYRCSKTKRNETFVDIINEFPFLKKPYGFVMVNNDFEKKHPRANGLKLGWNNFCKTNIQNLRDMINDPDIRQSLRDINILDETNYVNSEFAKALHGLAIPVAVTWQNKRWKPSIGSSQDAFFQNAANRESMELKLKTNLKGCDQKKLQHYPIIFGIGDDEENLSQYLVAISDVIYTFPSFIDAMDAAFKCYIFFNISFPPQVIRFWTLINEIFFKVNISQLELPASLSAILKSLD